MIKQVEWAFYVVVAIMFLIAFDAMVLDLSRKIIPQSLSIFTSRMTRAFFAFVTAGILLVIIQKTK